MRYVRPIGLIVLGLWAGFWVPFNVASGLGEGAGIEVGHLLLGAVIAAAAGLAWRYPRPGGVVLLGLAAAGLGVFGPSPFLLATLIAPPVVAALLLELAAARPSARLSV
jgi:hypothetical protein